MEQSGEKLEEEEERSNHKEKRVKLSSWRSITRKTQWTEGALTTNTCSKVMRRLLHPTPEDPLHRFVPLNSYLLMQTCASSKLQLDVFLLLLQFISLFIKTLSNHMRFLVICYGDGISIGLDISIHFTFFSYSVGINSVQQCSCSEPNKLLKNPMHNKNLWITTNCYLAGSFLDFLCKN